MGRLGRAVQGDRPPCADNVDGIRDVDRTGRALQKVWQDTNATGVGVNVVNRPGGGGQVAWTYLAQHAGDPHYLQIASPTLLARYITGLGTFQFTDFTPLALLGSQYLGAAVRPDSPVKTARDLMERLKREPYSFSVGIYSAEYVKHLHTEDARLRSALTALGLARQ